MFAWSALVETAEREDRGAARALAVRSQAESDADAIVAVDAGIETRLVNAALVFYTD